MQMDTVDCEKLIRLVYENDILYNQHLPCYTDNNMKNHVWKSISTEMGRDVDDLKRKWKSLRDTYSQKRRAIKNQKRGSIKYRSKAPWRFEESLKFLDDHMTFTKNTDKSDAEDNDDMNWVSQDLHLLATQNEVKRDIADEEEEEEDQQTRSPLLMSVSTPVSHDTADHHTTNKYSTRSSYNKTTPKRIRLDPEPEEHVGTNELSQTLRDIVQLIHGVPNQHTQELSIDEHFGISVGKTLARMSAAQSALAKLKIQQVLLEVEFGSDRQALQYREASSNSATIVFADQNNDGK